MQLAGEEEEEEEEQVELFDAVTPPPICSYNLHATDRPLMPCFNLTPSTLTATTSAKHKKHLRDRCRNYPTQDLDQGARDLLNCLFVHSRSWSICHCSMILIPIRCCSSLLDPVCREILVGSSSKSDPCWIQCAERSLLDPVRSQILVGSSVTSDPCWIQCRVRSLSTGRQNFHFLLISPNCPCLFALASEDM